MSYYIFNTALFILFSHFFTSCLLSTISDKERSVDSVLNKTSTRLEKKYGMKTVGTGGAMMYEVKSISLRLSVYTPLSIDEGRFLIVKSAEQLLEDINNDQILKPYLIHHPFDINDIDIAIFYSGSENIDQDITKLDYVSTYCGLVNYTKLDPNKLGKELVDKTETFEEALSILNAVNH